MLFFFRLHPNNWKDMWNLEQCFLRIYLKFKKKIFPDFESSIHSFKEYLKDKYKKENQIPWHLKTKVTNYNMVMKLLVDFYLWMFLPT